jgi:hypothetical protein
MLRACALQYGTSWDKSLPYAEFSYNNSYQQSLKMASGVSEFLQDASENSDVVRGKTEFTPKFYRMNPETEILVPDGHSIRPGMVVLIEDADSRVKIKDQMEEWEEYRALAANRWCTVSDIAINGQFIVFTGTYEDGSQRRRSTSVESAWLVKKNDVLDPLMSKKTDEWLDGYIVTLDTVRKAFKENELLASRHDYPADEIEVLAQKTAEKLMGFFDAR